MGREYLPTLTASQSLPEFIIAPFDGKHFGKKLSIREKKEKFSCQIVLPKKLFLHKWYPTCRISKHFANVY